MLPCTSRACSWRRKDRGGKKRHVSDMSVEKSKKSQSQNQPKCEFYRPKIGIGCSKAGLFNGMMRLKQSLLLVSIGGCDNIVPNSWTCCHYHCGCSFNPACSWLHAPFISVQYHKVSYHALSNQILYPKTSIWI